VGPSVRRHAVPSSPSVRPGWTVTAAPRTVGEVVLAPLAVLLAVARWVYHRPAVLAAATVLLVCVPLNPRDVSTTPHITPGDVTAFLLVVVVTVRVIAGERLPRHRLWWAMVAAVAGFAIAMFTSHDPYTSLSGFVRYTQLFVIVPLAVVLALRNRKDALLVCGAALLAAVIEGVVGAVQYITGAGASYGGQNVRAVGTFSALDIQAMATVVAYGMVIAVGLAITVRGRARGWLLLTALLLFVPLLLSFSRGSLIATIVALAIMLVVTRPRRLLPIAVYAGCLLLLVTSLLGPRAAPVGARLDSIGSSTSAPDQSVADRYALWKTATSMWQSRPITGVGLKEFPAYRDTYASVNLSAGSDVEGPHLTFQREPLLTPHNMYLLVISESGIIGALGLGSLLFGLAVITIRRLRAQAESIRGADPDGRGSVGVAALGVVAWTMVNFVYSDIGGQTTVLMAILLGVAMWWATRKPTPAVRTATPPT
jgi:O-antigen ligase